MSTSPASPQRPLRHPLGLPAGSVRAMLAFAVLGLMWAMVVIYGPNSGFKLPDPKLPLVFVYLQILMVLILAHYFAAHGKSIGRHLGERSALGLPQGSVRFLLLAGYLGLAAFLYFNHHEYQPVPSGKVTLLLGVLLVAFLAGYVINRMVNVASGDQPPFWYQDFQAWIALLAVIMLTVVTIWHVFIVPSLPTEHIIETDKLEAVLAGLVGFYFGARS